MQAIISKGRFEPGQGVLVIIFTIGLFFLSRYLFINAFSYQYLQIDSLIIAIAFTLLFLYFIFKGFEEYKAVSVYETQLKVRWLFGLGSIRVEKDDIRQFGESKIKGNNYIYIKTDHFDFLLNESLTDNYFELIDQLREWRIKRRDNLPVSEISNLEKKLGGFAMMVFGVFMFIGIFWGSYINPISTTDRNDLTVITGHLSGQPDVVKPSLRSSSTNVIFELKEYPLFRFEANYPGYKAIDLKSMPQYKKDDIASLLITKNTYSKKIAKTVAPTYYEKHFGWKGIQIYEVEIMNNKVLQLEAFNAEALSLRHSNQKWGFIALGLAVWLFWSGFKAFRKQ